MGNIHPNLDAYDHYISRMRNVAQGNWNPLSSEKRAVSSPSGTTSSYLSSMVYFSAKHT